MPSGSTKIQWLRHHQRMAQAHARASCAHAATKMGRAVMRKGDNHLKSSRPSLLKHLTTLSEEAVANCSPSGL